MHIQIFIVEVGAPGKPCELVSACDREGPPAFHIEWSGSSSVMGEVFCDVPSAYIARRSRNSISTVVR